MRLPPRRRRPLAWAAAWIGAVLVVACGGGAGRTLVEGGPASSPRDFLMATWDNPAGIDADLPMVSEGDAPPVAGRYLLVLASWEAPDFESAFSASLSANGYDLSRIDAVIVDEPYWNVTNGSSTGNRSNPCVNASDPRLPALTAAATALQTAGSVVRKLSPKTRFWVNFSEPEVQWLMSGACSFPINGSHIDVVSLDRYGQPFAPLVQGFYDWIVAHRAQPGQQIALVPGIFTDGSNAVYVANMLSGFFAYAQAANETCDLPPGNNGTTGVRDGCLVWMVAGWTSATFVSPSGTYLGERDPASGPIRDVWVRELQLPVR